MANKNPKTSHLKHKLTAKEASKGGKRSGEVRAARKTLREGLLLLLAEGNTQENLIVALLDKAMKGDVAAFNTIRDTIGEKPKDVVDVNGGIPLTITVKGMKQ